MPNLAQLLVDAATTYADRPALRLDDAVLTYSELCDRAGRVAAGLQAAGLKPGDRVGIVMPNVVAFPVTFYGALLAGGVVVPMNPLLKSREVAYFLSDSGATMVVAYGPIGDDAAKAAADIGIRYIAADLFAPPELLADSPITAPTPRTDGDDAVILYTSGTTGQPKGAQLTHGNLHSNALTSAEAVIDVDEFDVIMGCLPLFHVFGMTCGMNVAVSKGALLTLIPRFDPAKALAVIARDRVTVFEGVPTMYAAMLNHPDRASADVSTLKTCACGGAPLPVEILKAFEAAFGCAILEGYGLSETSPVASFNMRSSGRKPGTIGVAIPGVSMRLLGDGWDEVAPGEIGEIAIKGPNVMKGYWNKPEATADVIRDGWFRSGDLATVDEEGFYTIVDRKKDMIIRGGYNVYPREIEEVLYEHPDVLEAAVVGVPHPELGEEVAAAVSLRAGSEATPDSIRDFVKARIAAYKYPRHVWITSELPKGPTGKILRREVRAPAE